MQDAIWATLYEYYDFGGGSFTLNIAPDDTYSAVDIDFIGGMDLNDKISSFIVSKTEDEAAGELDLFAYASYRGPYLRYRFDIASVPIHRLDFYNFNDVTSSAVLVRHYTDETAFALGALGLGAQIDNTLSSSIVSMSQGRLSLRGNTYFTWDMWPRGYDNNADRWHPYDINSEFVVTVTPLTVNLPELWNYDAEIWNWIYLYIDSAGSLQGYVAYQGVWVERGIAGGDILTMMEDFLRNNDLRSPINNQLNNWLPTISGFGPFAKVYYIPGNVNGDMRGNAVDDVSVVLVK